MELLHIDHELAYEILPTNDQRFEEIDQILVSEP